MKIKDLRQRFLLSSKRSPGMRILQSWSPRRLRGLVDAIVQSQLGQVGRLAACRQVNLPVPLGCGVDRSRACRTSPSTRRKVRWFVLIWLALFLAAPVHAQYSVARRWDEALLDAIRIDFPAPTVHARNLYHTSAAMYDAWAAFDNVAQGQFYSDKHSAGDATAARNEAVSYAAYRVLSQRYQRAVDPAASQAIFDNLMNSLGYDPKNETTVGNSPAAIGNRIARQILDSTLQDGSNEPNNYIDNTGYQPVNYPMTVDYPSVVPPDAPGLTDPNRWQPLFIDSALTQNGLMGTDLQVFVGPHWGQVTPFAVGRHGSPGPYPWSGLDPGPPPQLGGVGDAEYKSDTMALIEFSNSLDPHQGAGAELINISPNTAGNRPLGTHDDHGYALNPATGQPYADNLVKRADYGRLLAEFWADGPHSETPPGHWNVIANEVADNPSFVKQIGGTGRVVDDLEWDVKTYLALNGAVHDAAVTAWGLKREYDYVRPITKIRYQGSLGQSSDPGQPSYDPDGLPLQPDFVELITEQSIAFGGRHRNVFDNANVDHDGQFFPNYTEAEFVGKIAVRAWNHEPEDPATQVSGSAWILAENWVPYQSDNFVTPAFAAYISGHSTFSRAAAEVLAKLTGSEFFPGGLGEAEFSPGFLEFEYGPSQTITLNWATYFDAADEAGISRLWGGIHVPADDFRGRVIGSQLGIDAALLALEHFTGPGDFDNNGFYEASDVDALVAAIAAASTDPGFDLTGDGLLNEADLTAWRSEAGWMLNDSRAPMLLGDANLDGTVDGLDFISWNAAKFTATAAWSHGDFNADGSVDGQDFIQWNANKFQSSDSIAAPEPIASFALLLFAGGLFFRRTLA